MIDYKSWKIINNMSKIKNVPKKRTKTKKKPLKKKKNQKHEPRVYKKMRE